MRTLNLIIDDVDVVLWELPWGRPYLVGVGISGIAAAIALPVMGQALAQPARSTHAVAAPLERCELVIQPFDTTAGLLVDDVLREQLAPAVQQ